MIVTTTRASFTLALGAALCANGLCATLLGASEAWAGTFDERGRYSTEGSALALDLDDRNNVPGGFGLELYDATYTPLSPPMASGQFVDDSEGLEGDGNLRFGGSVIYGTLSLAPLPDTLAGRRVAITVWQRPEGTRAAFDLYVYGGDYQAAAASGDYENLIYVGAIGFRPTGRVTSDGWEEWSTGPFDFEGPNGTRPSLLTFFDSQLKALQQSYFAGYDDTLRVSLDALEVHDLGPAAVPNASCRLVDEAEVCGEQGVCLYGRCVDAALVAGAPPLEAMRSDYVDRRLFEYKTFSGGRVPLSRMELLEEALEPLKADGASARFWPTFDAAVADLYDGHASAAVPHYPATSTVGVCAHLGEADLLPTGGLAPLVFELNSQNPITAQLEVGDVITAIDGLPPEVWARLAPRLISYPGDPLGFFVVTAPALLDAAAMAGSVVTFSRCPLSGAEPAVCGDLDVETFDVDFAAELGDLMWGFTPPAWRTDFVECDYRFERPVEHPNVRSGDFAGFADDEAGVRSLLINAVPALYGDEGEAWGQTVRTALMSAPEKLILDQRLGHGGSVDAVDLLTGMLVDPQDFSHMDMLPSFERPFDEPLLVLLQSCAATGDEECGAYFPWALGETIPQDEGAAASSKLAILIGSDVSGNDFTTKLLSYRSADTRIFGGAPTWGAFGVIWTLPPWHEELIGGSFQVHDTLFSTPGAPSMAFTTSQGVAPDEVVLQRQSDALLGRDTVLEAARTWLATP